VYKQKLTDPKTTDKDLKRYYKKMFVFLLFIGLPPFLIFMFIGKELFSYVFGSEWRIAGEYAVILAPMFYLRFIASPLSYFLYLKEKQEVNIVAHIALVSSSLLAFYFCKSVPEILATISIIFSLIYLWYIVYSSYLAGIFIFEGRNNGN
jgi:O-antigen/teichoic acid export membrane protein